MGACICNSGTQNIDPYEKYDFGQLIRECATYRIVEVSDKNNKDKKLAIKILSKKKRLSQTLYKREVDILARIKHSNIVEFNEGIEDDSSYYIVTGLYEGGDLFDRVVNPEYNITEKIAASLICDILKTIKYLHENNIVHRNIKPENFVFNTQNNDDINIILINFGSAEIVDDEKEYKDIDKTLVGSTYYMAPELVPTNKNKKELIGDYDKTGKLLKYCDIWSIGVTAYVLLTGSLPFNGKRDKDVFNGILKDELIFPYDVKLSAGFRDFIQKMLIKQPYDRMTIDHALCHPWIKGVSDIDIELNNEILLYLQQDTNKQTKFKEAVTKCVASNGMSSKFEEKVKKHWNRLDWDGRGFLNEEDMKDLLLNIGYTQNEAIKEAKLMINGHKNGRIYYNQFKEIWQRKFMSEDKKYIQSLFDVFDKNGDGYIDDKDIQRVLNVNNIENIKEMIEEIDDNNSGKLSLKQFENAMFEEINVQKKNKSK